jgi:hypothetical protein
LLLAEGCPLKAAPLRGRIALAAWRGEGSCPAVRQDRKGGFFTLVRVADGGRPELANSRAALRMQEEIEQLACEGALCRRVNGDYGGEMLEEIEQRCLW